MGSTRRWRRAKLRRDVTGANWIVKFIVSQVARRDCMSHAAWPTLVSDMTSTTRRPCTRDTAKAGTAKRVSKTSTLSWVSSAQTSPICTFRVSRMEGECQRRCRARDGHLRRRLRHHLLELGLHLPRRCLGSCLHEQHDLFCDHRPARLHAPGHRLSDSDERQAMGGMRSKRPSNSGRMWSLWIYQCRN